MHVIEKIMAEPAGREPVEICKIVIRSLDFADFEDHYFRRYFHLQGFSGIILI
jgi:hypothetical protein